MFKILCFCLFLKKKFNFFFIYIIILIVLLQPCLFIYLNWRFIIFINSQTPYSSLTNPQVQSVMQSALHKKKRFRNNHNRSLRNKVNNKKLKYNWFAM